MADSSREAGQQKLRKKLPTALSTGLFGNGSDRMGSETALILKPPQARGASSAWPIRGIMERCRAPGMAKNSLYRGLPSRCQNPGCIYRYICKFVAKVQPGSVCLQRNRRFCVNEQQAGVRASARRLPDGSKYPACPVLEYSYAYLDAARGTAVGRLRRICPDPGGPGSALVAAVVPASPSIDTKADESPVTQADREVEAALRAAISQQYPSTAFLAKSMACSRPRRNSCGRWTPSTVRAPSFPAIPFGAPCWRCCTGASRCWA